MPQFFTQPAILLKKISYGEADEILTVLFKEDGVRRLFVRHSKNSKKRFAGVLDHFAFLKLTYSTPVQGLWSLHEASLLKEPFDLFWKNDLKVYGFFNFLAEMICEFSPEGAKDPLLFDLWSEAALHLKQQDLTSVWMQGVVSRFLREFGYALKPSEVNLEGTVRFAESLLQKPLKSSEFLMTFAS